MLHLKDLADGRWIAEWWDTVDAKKIKTDIVESKNNQIVLEPPVVNASIAVKLRKII